MAMKNPYEVIKQLYVTEKSMMLENLKNAKGSRSLSRCNSPKYVFIVDTEATKPEVADAIEEIYKDRNVKVVAVNTLRSKAKSRRVRGRMGMTGAFKKAIVTLQEGDSLENV